MGRAYVLEMPMLALREAVMVVQEEMMSHRGVPPFESL